MSESGGEQVGAVYRDILEWSAALPLWQHEMLRRLLHCERLTNEEVAELSNAAVAEFEQQPSTYAPLAESDLPAVAGDDSKVTLRSMKALQNVNALREDQELTFGEHLTVIYGENASGKSGYSRVLKKVYRARVVEDILPNLRADTVPTGAASAVFVADAGGPDPQDIPWAEGGDTSKLGRFAVLDSQCSRTYVTGGELAVGPAGIDVPQRFADELDRVKAAMTARASLPSKAGLQALENESPTGQFVKTLSATTKAEDLAAAAMFTPDDEARLGQVRTLLATARSQTPSQRRVKLQGRSTALEGLRKLLRGWVAAVTDDAAAKLRAAIDAVTAAEQVVSTTKALGDEHAPSDRLGTQAWREVVTAALAYTQEQQQGPDTLAVDGQCALCWQPLTEPAADRLASFVQFVRGDAEKQRIRAVAARDEMLKALREIPSQVAEATRATASTEGEGMVDAFDASHASLVARRDVLLRAVEANDWSVPLPEIDRALAFAAEAVKKSVDEELASIPATDADANQEIAKLQAQVQDLETRHALAGRKAEAERFIEATREYQRLTGAVNAINTRTVSTKAGQLHTKHMTGRYQELVNDELTQLRFRRPKPVLSHKTKKARVEVAPIVSKDLRTLAPERVFSEGERTAIALASFLAELRLGADSSGLIFDDPVSSLDHTVRDHVARRLVAAAKDRQVIVFTHDLSFFVELRHQAEDVQGVPAVFRTFSATDFHAGFVASEEPFGAKNVRKRVGQLKDLLVDAERAAKDGDAATFRVKAHEFYDRLRSTWERFIEEHMFGKAVMRLQKNVSPGRLDDVAYSKELVEQVKEGHGRCSTLTLAHDHSAGQGEHSYSLEEMRADLAQMETARQTATALTS